MISSGHWTPNLRFVFVCRYRAVFKWLLRNQYQSNYSNQSQQEKTARWIFVAVTSNLLKAREKKATRTRCAWFWSCFSLVGKLVRYFKPITRRRYRNRVITFYSHLKAAQYRTHGVSLRVQSAWAWWKARMPGADKEKLHLSCSSSLRFITRALC